MRVRLLAVALAACGFSPHGASDGGGGSGSMQPTDAPCPSATEQFDTCMFGSGSDLAITTDAIYNTDTGTLVANDGAAIPHRDVQLLANGVTIDVLVVGKLQLSATLIVEGSLPLAIYASGNVTIDGGELTIDSGDAGARATCTQGPVAGTNNKEGGGGGGGGSFQGTGGSGGPGSNGNEPGGAGGTAMALPATLVGGCAGAIGGTGDNSIIGGAGGFGGGVLLIATPGTIVIGSGGIDANGEGGQVGGSNKTGGGGGGAGGLIVLEASAISNGGHVVANGGGGAEGENSDGGSDGGRPGSNGSLSTMQAAGGAGGTGQGGDGGSGGAGSSLDGIACTDVVTDGGGGGGGGVGYIGVTQTPSGGGVFSPSPTTWPMIH
ncbi:MAG TPA: hypothetical protein VGL61_26835 [Kofleriaceae bacterium]|jgi:hypothetical protein